MLNCFDLFRACLDNPKQDVNSIKGENLPIVWNSIERFRPILHVVFPALSVQIVHFHPLIYTFKYVFQNDDFKFFFHILPGSIVYECD